MAAVLPLPEVILRRIRGTTACIRICIFNGHKIAERIYCRIIARQPAPRYRSEIRASAPKSAFHHIAEHIVQAVGVGELGTDDTRLVAGITLCPCKLSDIVKRLQLA